MDIAADRFAIIRPYTDRRDRLDTATVVSTHATAAEAFAELERVAERLHGFNIPGDAIEMLVVDAQRRLVVRGALRESLETVRWHGDWGDAVCRVTDD